MVHLLGAFLSISGSSLIRDGRVVIYVVGAVSVSGFNVATNLLSSCQTAAADKSQKVRQSLPFSSTKVYFYMGCGPRVVYT